MKKQDLFNLNQMLDSIESNTVKFSYFVAKNKKIIEPIVQPIKDVRQKVLESIAPYEQGRMELLQKYSDKDEDGNPIVKNNSFSVTENRKKFDKEISKLEEENKEKIEQAEEDNKELGKILDEEVEEDIKFHTIKIDNLPEEGINPKQMELLINLGLIEEDE